MLTSLSIRNVLLIDRLEIEFRQGLCVLTGETGAGKSILLDALNLVIGGRASSSVVRGGTTSQENSVITASFDLPKNHIARRKLTEKNIEINDEDEPIILRRTLTPDSRSRAFINDQQVSVGTLRNIGETLIEIEGQFASHGLLNSVNHRNALDAFGNLTDLVEKTDEAWKSFKKAENKFISEQTDIERISADGHYLRHVCTELIEIDPKDGEEATLVAARSLKMNAEKLTGTLEQSLIIISGDGGIQENFAKLIRSLERINQQTGESLTTALDSLVCAETETANASEFLKDTLFSTKQSPEDLEQIEERLFALRALARKHNTDIASLPGLRDELVKKLQRIEGSGHDLARLESELTRAKAEYTSIAHNLHNARMAVAEKLDFAINKELPHLRLEKANFTTKLNKMGENQWAHHGMDGVNFEVQTNPGQPGGPINKVASGGELARLLLALKVTLFKANRVCTLVFDEVDAGVSGATAASIAQRLSRLSGGVQVLVVTHSPQVAARGIQHFLVRKTINKSVNGDETVTTAAELTPKARREEIAQMLSGATVTDEARAAAKRLLTETDPET